jgi:hypothetical protein
MVRNTTANAGATQHSPKVRQVGLAKGTKLLTPQGYQPVETIRKGDCLLTLRGRDSIHSLCAPVIWVGRRQAPPPQAAGFSPPICLRPHAINDNMPMADVILAPEHGIYLEGAFYYPRMLVNRASILEADVPNREFWAVELSTHDVISAEGLWVESFLDDGARVAFTEVTAPSLRVVAGRGPTVTGSSD